MSRVDANLEVSNVNAEPIAQPDSVHANVSPVVDIAGGDFVGRDKVLFAGRDSAASVTISGHVAGNVTIVMPQTRIERVIDQIERLRGRVTRLIPAEEALLQLSKLREPSTIGSRVGGELTTRVSFMGVSLTSRVFTLVPPAKDAQKSDTPEEFLSELAMIEAQLSPEIEPQRSSELLQRLSSIADEVNVRIARLNSLFVSLAFPATSSKESVGNMVSKIGHRELREEAKMHLGVTEQLVAKLDVEQLTGREMDVLSDEAQAAVGVMTEIEKRRLVVEKLIQSDRRRRNWTVTVVLAYMAIITAVVVILSIRWGTQFIIGDRPLDQQRLPLLGIPWPVIVWSLIGSFAAMIHRFNRRPIYDFGDAVKWLLTRPFQGVVLGSALYLVLVSGLFLLTGGRASNPASLVVADEVILVLCFLVGFSDRVADGVFNTLVEKYAAPPNQTETVSRDQ